MIDAQSIVVSSTATKQVGKEAEIFKAVFKHSIILATMVVFWCCCTPMCSPA